MQKFWCKYELDYSEFQYYSFLYLTHCRSVDVYWLYSYREERCRFFRNFSKEMSN